jgi:hypothetical protein
LDAKLITVSSLNYEDQQFTIKDLLMNEQIIKKNHLTIERELNQVLITKYFTTGFTKYSSGSTVLESRNLEYCSLVAPDILQYSSTAGS